MRSCFAVPAAVRPVAPPRKRHHIASTLRRLSNYSSLCVPRRSPPFTSPTPHSTLVSLCANRVNIVAGTPQHPQQPHQQPQDGGPAPGPDGHVSSPTRDPQPHSPTNPHSGDAAGSIAPFSHESTGGLATDVLIPDAALAGDKPSTSTSSDSQPGPSCLVRGQPTPHAQCSRPAEPPSSSFAVPAALDAASLDSDELGAGQRAGDGQRSAVNGGGQRLVSAALQHVWLADCNVRGAPADALAGSMPALQTLVVRNQCQAQDLPPRLLAALGDLKVGRGRRRRGRTLARSTPFALVAASLNLPPAFCIPSWPSTPCTLAPGPALATHRRNRLLPSLPHATRAPLTPLIPVFAHQDLTTLGLGGFSHTQLPELHGLTRLRHLMLDPRRFGDTEVDPDVSSSSRSKSGSFRRGCAGLKAQLQHLTFTALPAFSAPLHVSACCPGKTLGQGATRPHCFLTRHAVSLWQLLQPWLDVCETDVDDRSLSSQPPMPHPRLR